jgi:hypothetical protein
MQMRSDSSRRFSSGDNMRKKIEYRQYTEDDTKETRLLIEISSIRTNAEMKSAIDEVIGLGFEIRYIEDGEIGAHKASNNPLDIVDPIYDSYRCLVRACDD